MKVYEGCELIDLIVEHNLIELLEHEKMDMLVTMYWNGPYALKNFLNSSLKFWTTLYLMNKFTRFSKWVGANINELKFSDIVKNRLKVNGIFGG